MGEVREDLGVGVSRFILGEHALCFRYRSFEPFRIAGLNA